MSITAPGKFRALTPIDKKQIAILRSIVDELGTEVALRANNLDALFSKIRNVARELPTSEGEGPNSLSAACIQKLQDIINQQEKAFRDDALGIYHYELDEDLLIPIAHECLSMWNRVEGFDTAAYVPPTDEERQKKKTRIEQAKSKREQAFEKQKQEKIQRELERQKREEVRKAIASPFHDAITVEDSHVLNGRALGFVDYFGLPLGDPKEFSRALEIWTFLVSLPQVLTLSQYSLSMFLTSLQNDSETFLIQETCRMLVQVGVKTGGWGSPLVKMPVKTTGRNWFDQVREYLLVASGAKQQKKEEMERKKKLALKQLEMPQEEDEERDDKEMADDAGLESEDEGAEVENNDPEDIDFMTDFNGMMQAMEEMKGRAGWSNFNIHDRLVLLKFLVDSILQARAVISDADTVTTVDAAEQAIFDKSVKELRDECEKELRSAGKKKGDGSEVSAAETRENIVRKMRTGVDEAFQKRVQATEKDTGARIVPVGEDRYGRLYWRFPLDANVYVQTVPTTKTFPIPVKVKSNVLMDDDETPVTTPEVANAAPKQTTWGRIVPADLEPFIASLEIRGTKEMSLKTELERYVSHLTSLAVTQDKVRISRSRTANKAYNNKLNIPAMLPY